MRIIRLIENQSVRNIVRFLTFLKPYWRKGVHAGFWMTLSVLLRLPLPLLTMYIIDHVLVAKNLSMLNWICLGLILVLLFQIIASLLHRYLLLVFKERVIFDIQLKLFQHIERLSFKFFQSKQTGYLMSRIQNDTNAVHGLLADTVLNFCRDVLTFIVGLTIIFVIHWKLALASIAVLPCFVISLTAFIRKLRNLSKQVQESYAVVAQNLQQSLSGIYLVKSFVRQKFQARKLLCSLKSLIKINIKRGMMGSLLGNLTTLIGSAGPLAVLWYGGSEIIRGNLTIGQLIAFNAFLPYLFGPTQRLVNLNFSVQQSLGAIERIFEMMDLEPEVKEIDGAKKLPKIEGYVQFDNVSFSYDEVKNVLENINLSAEPGQIVAVVGYSG
ncbi:MAG: ABC transporter ATP-binding protein, partial [Candidatus Poribacteria bacterium]